MRRQAFLRQGCIYRRLKHIEKQLARIDCHCGFRFSRWLPGNIRFPVDSGRAAGQCRDRDRVRISGAQDYLSRWHGPRAANMVCYIADWRCRFIAANTALSTVVSPGDTVRGDNL
jgi:hypothetical protein